LAVLSGGMREKACFGASDWCISRKRFHIGWNFPCCVLRQQLLKYLFYFIKFAKGQAAG
jgi:hypothetical protein